MIEAFCKFCEEPTDRCQTCENCRRKRFLCGHPKTPANSLWHDANGYRYVRCKTCRNAYQRAYRERRRA